MVKATVTLPNPALSRKRGALTVKNSEVLSHILWFEWTYSYSFSSICIVFWYVTILYSEIFYHLRVHCSNVVTISISFNLFTHHLMKISQETIYIDRMINIIRDFLQK